MNFNFIQRWTDKVRQSLFFFIALLFHLILFLMVATWVIFQAPTQPKEDFAQAYVPSAPPPPPPPPTTPQTVAVSPTAVPTTATAITTTSSVASFSVPMPQIDATIDPSMTHQMVKSIAPQVNSLSSRLGAIRNTVTSWRSADNIRDAGGDVHNLVAKFPVYLAQYADGDWYCDNFCNDDAKPGELTSGCLANLVNEIQDWSRKGLQGGLLKVISVTDPMLISSPPPYIFFTGHKDFHLTNDEVTALRNYLQAGGAIWGDSAFAGDGSRFDVAFHREMKRVLPDPEIKFENLPMDHPIFTKSWFPIDHIPLGMNYRQDPVEVVNLDGKLAIVYTPNDYSDMMTAALSPGSEEAAAQYNGVFAYDVKYPLWTVGEFCGHPTFYRNFTPAASMAVFKLSMNILAHLLIRFDNDLLLAP